MDVPQWVREMRGQVAEYHGIKMPHKYPMKQACEILDVDYTTLKRWVREKKIFPVRLGGKIHFLGLHLVDAIIAGSESVKWHDTSNASSASVNGSSDSVPVALPSIDAASTLKSDAQTASASARLIFGKPAND